MDHAELAIKAALERRWKDAITENLLSLKENPKDPDSLNRLGRAYLETGQKTKATETYQKVLKIDKFNVIAQKNLVLLKTFKVSRDKEAKANSPRQPAVFLEEPGVTKTISLIRLGDVKILSHLHPADEVKIVSRQHTVCVVTPKNDYVGKLPDDLAFRLRDFLKEGNVYDAWIRSVEVSNHAKVPTAVKIFVREVSRAPKFKLTPSFPMSEKLTYAAFTPPELIHEEKPDVSSTEEQDLSSRGGGKDMDNEELPVAEN